MTIARNICGSSFDNGTVIITDYQNEGRGRGAGRRWDSQKGKNLLFTVVLKFNDFSQAPNAVTLRAGAAVFNAIKELLPGLHSTLSIKWPNDIMIYNKKVSGIVSESDGKNIFIGIGINVLQEDFPASPAATSIINTLFDLHNTPLNVDTIRFVLLEHILKFLHILLDKNNEAWHIILNDNLYKKNEYVRFLSGGTKNPYEVCGILSGINDDGELLILNQPHDAAGSVSEGSKEYLSFANGELLF